MKLLLAFFICLILFQAVSGQTAELDEATELNRQVVRLYQEGKIDEALPLARRVLQMREKALGKDHQLVSEALLNLAELNLAKKVYRESLEIYERILKSNQKLAGPDDPGNVVLLDKLGFLRYMVGDFIGAENAYKRSLAINEKIFGGESEQVAQAVYNLAEFYRFTNRYQRAEPHYQRSLAIRDKNLARDDAKLLRTVERYRCLFYQSDRMDRLKAFNDMRLALYKTGNPNEPAEVVNGRALSLPKPSYPQEARATRTTGIVVIRVMIDESGKVIKAEDMCGGNSWLVKAAMDVSYSARFSPTVLSGQPVKVSGIITYKFGP